MAQAFSLEIINFILSIVFLIRSKLLLFITNNNVCRENYWEKK